LANFEIVAELTDLSTARTLVTALKAYGFCPLEGDEAGLPGMPGIRGARGVIAIKVPAHEAHDARLLANDLLADMQK